MCGIFGIASPSLPANSIIKTALDTIRHRGPDDEGYFFFDTRTATQLLTAGVDSPAEIKKRQPDILETDVAGFDLLLANRRLSILDLTAAGHQPLGNTRRDLWITHNGEIFNYQELRGELKTKGYPFHSNTDTEVILAAYDYWGEDCTRRFNGQWAFCIFDKKKKSLFCSRDRFGIKPFYYWYDDERFVFASETHVFFKLLFIQIGLALPVLSDFLLHARLEHRRETVYQDIYQLLPGHNLSFDLTSKRVTGYPYYKPDLNPSMGSYSHAQALGYADDIRALLIDAVKVRLVSDVPVGSCLSGGLDSPSIAAAINLLLKEGAVGTKAMEQGPKTFTASFKDPAVDEKHLAQEVIRHLGVNGFFCYPRACRLWQDLDRFLYVQDGLCFGTNIYAGWVVMQQAAGHVKVVLNGQGSDELFGGYDRYHRIWFAELLRHQRVPEFLKAVVKKARMNGIGPVLHTALRACAAVGEPRRIKQYRTGKMARTNRSIARHLLGPDVPSARSAAVGNMVMGTLNGQLGLDQTSAYLPMLLRYDDRNAASVSIENRVPFLDHRLVDYVNAIPSVYKVHDGWSKWLLRLAMRELLPDKIIWHKTKNGFASPHKRWLAHPGSPARALMKKYHPYPCDTFIWRLLLVEKMLSGVSIA